MFCVSKNIMGLSEYKESSSEKNEVDGDIHRKEEEDKDKEGEKKVLWIRKKKKGDEKGESRGFLENEVRFGEQLQDDLINSFCDKLQAVCPRKLEALFAIQFLMITDETEISKHVTGENSAIQVLYDRRRAHYILVHYNPERQTVEFFDSLQMFDREGSPWIHEEVQSHISHLFGHLFTSHIALDIDKEYERQADNFSCGYRVVGALVDLAREQNPSTQTYSRSAILSFMRKILSEKNPTWEVFENARIGRDKEYNGRFGIRVCFQNSMHPTSSTSSSSSILTSSASSSLSSLTTDSLSSVISESSSEEHSDDFRNYGRRVDRRALAGYSTLRRFDHYQDMVSDRIFKKSMPFYYSERLESSLSSPATAVESQNEGAIQSESSIIGLIRNGCQNLLSGIFRRKDVEDIDVEGKKEHQD
ncbi:hypothetical protein L3Y34_009521 [Caenorhabditis briggsae]|uniref:Ubiquitin-like protease family profile domain-containing protein n=1 Tax=Caenorhabditis briggsae TaxID=6238 RepID=A0AAE9A5W9_CAEBR|nr:hypothetical protein L3Y34_009521 [Caenorhabditis briggsae]